MSRRQLSIVVTCTDRKVGTPPEHLTVRSLPAGTVSERVAEWTNRIDAALPTARLIDLYRGDSWTQAKRLASTAVSTGYEPTLYVASAGLGLRAATEFGPTYAATFARGHQDSVASSTADTADWWRSLPHVDLPNRDSPSIWILSETYALAMSDHLHDLNPDAALVFGGAQSTPEDMRIRSDRHLRGALGGTLSSLNNRMATRWLEIADGRALASKEVRDAWARWAMDAQLVEQYDRIQVPDAVIIDRIRVMLSRHPSPPKSIALKELRASGIACEQRRFSGLFEEAFIE